MLSSLSINSSSNILVDPNTSNLPPELVSVNDDKIGQFAGYETGPVERIEIAGF